MRRGKEAPPPVPRDKIEARVQGEYVRIGTRLDDPMRYRNHLSVPLVKWCEFLEAINDVNIHRAFADRAEKLEIEAAKLRVNAAALRALCPNDDMGVE